MYIYASLLLKTVFIDFLSHPFVIATFVYFLGKYFIYDKLIPEKKLSIKLEIIKQVNIIREKLRVVKFYHDQAVFKSCLYEAKGKGGEYIEKIVNPKLDIVLKIADDEIPEIVASLETSIFNYFKDNEKIKESYKQYDNAVAEHINWLRSEFGFAFAQIYDGVLKFGESYSKYKSQSEINNDWESGYNASRNVFLEKEKNLIAAIKQHEINLELKNI